MILQNLMRCSKKIAKMGFLSPRVAKFRENRRGDGEEREFGEKKWKQNIMVVLCYISQE